MISAQVGSAEMIDAGVGQGIVLTDLAPGFRIRLHQKDLGLALDAARTLGLALPGTANAQQLFSACVTQREGRQRPFGHGKRCGRRREPRIGRWLSLPRHAMYA